MVQTDCAKNIVITVAAKYREEQIRPFLASLRHFSSGTFLKLIVDQRRPEFEQAVQAWFPSCSFHLLPPAPLRDFALKRKWAASIFKRLSRWSRSRRFGRRLLKINYLRHIVIRDLLEAANVGDARILLCDSRDLVFQADPFGGQWPSLWSCEEDKRLEECTLNSAWFKRVGGEAALQNNKHQHIVCAGVIGGTTTAIKRYLQQSSKIVEEIAPIIPLTDGDQGIHNNLVRLHPELGFTVLPNGGPLCANVGYTPASELVVEGASVRLRDCKDTPAILHQYDRHPNLTELINTRWANARPLAT